MMKFGEICFWSNFNYNVHRTSPISVCSIVLGPIFVNNSDGFTVNTELAILAFIAVTGAHVRGVWGVIPTIILRNVQKVGFKRTILLVPIVRHKHYTNWLFPFRLQIY